MNKTFKHNKKTVTIKTATKNDAELLVGWWNDGEVMAHAGFPLGVNTTKEKVENTIAKNSELRELLIIEIDKIPVGEMNYKIADDVAEFGIKICNKDFQNKGYGTAILKQLFKFLFNEKNVQKIWCDTNITNIRSQFVYENKLKMRRTKTLYNCGENQIGEKYTATVFEITRQEFLKL